MKNQKEEHRAAARAVAFLPCLMNFLAEIKKSSSFTQALRKKILFAEKS